MIRCRTRKHLHAARLARALELIENGTAKSRSHAARLAGISPDALKPATLTATLAKNAQLAALVPTKCLDSLGNVNGQPVTLRSALDAGMAKAVAVIGLLAPKMDSLTREEERTLKRAREHIALCRECGLWKDDAPPTPQPGELANQGEQATGSMAAFLAGLVQTKTRMLTVTNTRPLENADSPT